jgi:hypothetical protein
VVLTTTPWSPSQTRRLRGVHEGQEHVQRTLLPRRPASPPTAPSWWRSSCRNTVNPASVKAQAEAAIADLFTLRYGFLGATVYLSDIELACFNVDEGIKFVRITQPLADIYVGVFPPFDLTTTPLPAGGTLPIGNYNYGVTALNGVGETQLALYPQVILTAIGGVQLDWSDVPNATSYNIYRRVGGNMLLVGNSLVSSFTDTGAATPGAAHTGLDTSGVWYAVATDITVNVNFSERVPFNNR